MEKLLAEKLRDDPRVAEAKKLLAAALADVQREIVRQRAAREPFKARYQEQLASLAAARGGPTYFPYIASGVGNGPWVELADGSVKLDFISGIGVHALGHSHPDLLTAGVDAALEDTVMQGNLQHNLGSLRACKRLLKLAQTGGAPLGHCLLTTSGAMANENALKIAFHNRSPADRLIAIDNCFAGRTIATAQLTDRPQYRVGVPTALAVDYIPPIAPDGNLLSQQASLAALDKHLKRHPGKYAALWLELVSGEGGYYPGTAEYFIKLIERARRDDLLIIFDEVQTFGRLSQPFAFQHFGLDEFADIVTIGKLTQLCATLYRETLQPKGPLLSQTFTAASSSITAMEAILDRLETAGCFGAQSSNQRRHDYFAAQLAQLAEEYPDKVAGPFGCGMMIAMTPGDGSSEVANRMVTAFFDAGLLGFVAGGNPARIRFLPPPGITTEADIDAAVGIMCAVLRDFQLSP